MRIPSVIIVSSGAGIEAADRIDGLVRSIRHLKKNPILVLGPDGDDLLRVCTELESCDLVFDPNYEGDFFSGLKAGLHATTEAAYVVSAKDDFVTPEKWRDFERALGFGENEVKGDIIRPRASTLGSEFPQIVTPQGAKRLLTIPSSTTWIETIQAPTISVSEVEF